MPSLLSNQIDGLTYQVQQVHFHSPSEHHVDEKYYPLEAHFVHTSVDSKLNVIGLFFEIGPQDNPWIAQFVDTLPTSTTASTKLQGLDMSSIITAIAEADFFSYTGSLTTPPCTEGVLWLVARQPLKISQAQWDKLTKVMPFNSRTTQANKSGKNATESSHGNSNYTAVVTTAPAKVNVNSGATFLSAFTAFATLALLLL
ncbi:carbonic anhydrase, partial [Rhizoclosmatium globosum]